MSYRFSPIDIPYDAPFTNDKLERKELVDFVVSVVKQADDYPLVLAIDGPYGSGKSTFVSMVQAVLNHSQYQTVMFDAWKADHISDPLIALVAALDSAIPKREGDSQLSGHLATVKKYAGVIGKRAVIAGIKIGTAGILDMSADVEKFMIDAAGDSAKDLVDAYQAETKLVEDFRSELSNSVALLDELGKKKMLVFFIDELDRCRPDFAIALLERVKHMFDVPNVIFVLSVDRTQLEGATMAVYGDRINATEYLRKFIDLDFNLPVPSSESFVDSLISRAKLDEVFRLRTTEFGRDRNQFVKFFVMLSDIFGIGLRVQERCITRLKLVLGQTPVEEILLPVHAAFLIIIRTVEPALFWKVVNEGVGQHDMQEKLFKIPASGKYLETSEWHILMGVLIAEDRNPNRRNDQIVRLERESKDSAPNSSSRRRLTVIQALESTTLSPGEGFLMLAKKIDLVARIQR